MKKNGGYFWAPKKTKSGRNIFHWSNITKIKEEDIIFSMYKRQIVSVNIAKAKSIDSKKPLTLDTEELWENEGWLVKAEYHTLEKPIEVNNFMDEILSLNPSKYAPFNSTGKGNQGYLYEIGNQLGDYLIKLVNSKNDIDINI